MHFFVALVCSPWTGFWYGTAACGHIVYGSGAPLMEMMATTLQIETGALDDDAKEQIFGGKKLMEFLA